MRRASPHVLLAAWLAVASVGCQRPAALPRWPWPPRRGFQPPGAGEPWTNALGMVFAYVPPGDFVMGTGAAEAEELVRRFADTGLQAEKLAPEQPPHRVRLTRGFLMGRCEVTVGQFRRFVEAAGYKTDAERGAGPYIYNGIDVWEKQALASWRDPAFPQTDDHPVVCVSWHDAQAFVRWLNATDGRRPRGWVYRLPTEAEWEYAARGPRRRLWAWGDAWEDNRANFADRSSAIPWADTRLDDGHRRTARVGAYSPAGDSPFGIADLTGNVWEWCLDWYDPAYYATCPADDPANEAPRAERVERGGSWAFTQDYCRAAFRFKTKPNDAYDNLGFRVVLAPERP